MRRWNPETASLQPQARLMPPLSRENWSSPSAAQRGTESQGLGFGSGLHSQRPFAKGAPNSIASGPVTAGAGGAGNLQTPDLAAWHNQKMPGGCWFSPDSATGFLHALVWEALPCPLSHVKLSITSGWLMSFSPSQQ